MAVFSNILWKFAEQFCSYVVTLVVSIVLARLLEPSVFGVIAIVLVINMLLQVFVESGFGSALIQKKDADDLDFSSVFWFNLFSSNILYGCLFVAAPFIADFYGMPILTRVIQVLGLSVIVAGVKNVQVAYISRNMQFRRFFYATIGGTLLSAVVGIVMALRGYGVWALVGQSLTNTITDTAILWITTGWRPQWMFSLMRLKRLFNFGWKLLLTNLLESLYRNIYSLTIGKVCSASALAYYDRGQQFPNVLVKNVDASFSAVMFPALSRLQDQPKELLKMMRMSIRTSTFLLFPLLTGLAICAEPIIRLVLTEKWMEAVPFMQVFCFVFALYPLHTSNLSALKALGRSDLTLKVSIAKKVVGFATLLLTMWHGVWAIALGFAAASVLQLVINAYPNAKLLDYNLLQQIRDIASSFLLSIIMGIAVYAVSFLELADILQLLLQILVGAVTYIGMSLLTKNESLTYLYRNLPRPLPSRGEKKVGGKITNCYIEENEIQY